MSNSRKMRLWAPLLLAAAMLVGAGHATSAFAHCGAQHGFRNGAGLNAANGCPRLNGFNRIQRFAAYRAPRNGAYGCPGYNGRNGGNRFAAYRAPRNGAFGCPGYNGRNGGNRFVAYRSPRNGLNGRNGRRLNGRNPC
jgi:hypothetical protein